MNLDALIHLAGRFTPEQYLYWTRIQCTAWTLADVVIVVLVLLLCNRVRAAVGLRAHVFSFAVVGGTLCFLPGIWFVQQGWAIFFIELAITVPHFLILIYAALLNLHLFPGFLANILVQQATPNMAGEGNVGRAH